MLLTHLSKDSLLEGEHNTFIKYDSEPGYLVQNTLKIAKIDGDSRISCKDHVVVTQELRLNFFVMVVKFIEFERSWANMSTPSLVLLKSIKKEARKNVRVDFSNPIINQYFHIVSKPK